MKLQKTFLAVALALSAITANAAQTPTLGKTPVYQYGQSADLNAKDVIYKINGQAYQLVDGVGFVKFEGDASKYTNLLRGGLVDSATVIGQETEKVTTGGSDPKGNFSATKWSETLVVVEDSTTSLNGTITAPEQGTEQSLKDTIYAPGYSYLKQKVEQNVNVGVLESGNVGVHAMDSTLTYDKNNKLVSNVSSGTALTSKGLGLVANVNQANPNIKVDVEKGLVTETIVTGGTVSPNKQLKAYGTGSKIEVIEVDGKFYSVGANGSDLTDYTGDTSALASKLIGAGAANGLNDSRTEIKTTQAMVSAQNVTYAESTVKYNNANTITVGSADTNSVLEAGKQYNVGGANAGREETSQSVSTGVIGTNTDKSNQYGLNVNKTVTDAEGNKTTSSTTITADGISTTGAINAADYQINGVSIVDNIKTSVDTAVSGATEAIDKKIIEVDARLTEFNKTAGQLNSRVDQLNKRVDDIEKTSYRGIAIALAAQQQIPNIGAGQYAVFGGAGHYEGETAGAIGVASVFADGRTSVSAAVGFASGNEVGGRVGVSYVFGGK